MKFLGTSKKETQASAPPAQQTTFDGVTDPSILTSQVANTKKSFRYKKFNQVRISEIDTFCPREYALGYLTDTAAQSFVDFALQCQFDLGSALHWYYQNKSKTFKDTLCGWYKCLACGNYRQDKNGNRYFGTRPKTNCEVCGAKPEATEYEEFLFRLTEPYRIVGKIDAVLFKDGVYRLADFKSYAKKDNFPLRKDIAQVSSYAHFYNYVPEDQKFPVNIDTSIVYVIYISKAFSYRESILTYPIRPKKEMIDNIVGRVKQFTEATKTGVLPKPLEQCVKKGFGLKKCHMKELCKEKWEKGL